MRHISSIALLLMSCTGFSDQKLGIYNTAPNVSIVTPSDGSNFDEGTVIVFEAVIGDDFDSAESLQAYWSSDIDGEFEGGTPPDPSGTLLYSTANLSPGLHTITLLVIDSQQESASESIAITVNAVPDEPEIEIVRPANNESGVEEEAFSFVSQVYDAFDALNELDVLVNSDLDGDVCSATPDSSGLASCDGSLSVGQHLLTYTVTNTSGFTSSATAYFDIIALVEIDNDGDGYTENQGDCDDTDPSTSPVGNEVENGIDDNCNGEIDEGDDDGDGYNESQGDCDDNDPSVSPDGTEVENGVDDDCDGIIDNNTNAYDDDGDGFSENQGDCNDADPNVSPNATEVCGDGIDNDCNGSQNAENAIGCSTYYRDADNDGFGDPNAPYCDCAPGGPDGSFNSTNTLDCFDGNANANPQQSGYFSTHRGDGSFDYNCNGAQEQQYPNAGACDSWGTNIGDCTLGTAGWHGGVPACGGAGNYMVDNDSCSAGCEVFGVPFCCEEGGPSYQGGWVQTCR
jgi:hypothetical protein